MRRRWIMAAGVLLGALAAQFVIDGIKGAF